MADVHSQVHHCGGLRCLELPFTTTTQFPGPGIPEESFLPSQVHGVIKATQAAVNAKVRVPHFTQVPYPR